MSNNKKIEVYKTLKIIINVNTIICHRQIGMIFLEMASKHWNRFITG